MYIAFSGEEKIDQTFPWTNSDDKVIDDEQYFDDETVIQLAEGHLMNT